MPDRYAVFGNPIAHSKSARIHAEFARQTRQDLNYVALLAPLDGFAACVEAFRAGGGRGANVTVPFKEEAFRLAGRHSIRAQAAGAVNTLRFDDGTIYGDNTDGIGLVVDLARNLGLTLAGKRILLLGAGGAARGVILPLLLERPRCLTLVNRRPEKAVLLRDHFAVAEFTGSGEHTPALEAKRYEDLGGPGYDLVVNATAASLAGERLPLPDDVFAPGALAYDLMYGRDTPFLAFARQEGAKVADGLGMLVEQAAESFLLWRGTRPATRPVIDLLRGG
jgi:shikimate dehydrogenase